MAILGTGRRSVFLSLASILFFINVLVWVFFGVANGPKANAGVPVAISNNM